MKVDEDIQIITENTNLEEGKLEKIKILKEQLKATIDELTEKIEETQNLGFTSQKDIESLNSEISIKQAKIQNNEENKVRFEHEINDMKNKIIKTEEDMATKLSKKDNLKENKEKYEKQLLEKQASLDEINKTLSEKELEIEEDKKTLEKNTDLKYEIEGITNEQKVNIANIDKRKMQIEDEIQNNISELDNTRFSKEEIEKGFYEIQKSKDDLKKELDEIKTKKEKAEQEIKSIDITLNNSIQELNFKESKHKFLVETEKEKEGYQKSVKELLKECERIKELGKGVEGVIAELIEVPKELETAIEMTLGSSIQNIVTIEETDAKRLIEHLRKNNLGRASFLPISTVKGKKLETIKGKSQGVLGIASDLIKYDKKYEQVILNLLGRTVITDNMDTAIKLAKENGYTFRIVTMEGDIINPSGSISGGSVNKKTVKLLGRSKEIQELEKQIGIIKKTQEDLKAKKEEILNSSNYILENAKKLEDSLQTIEIKYNVEHQKLETINESIEKIAKHLYKIKQEKIELENQKQECLIIIEENNTKLDKIEIQNVGLKNKINEFAKNNKDKQKEVDDLNFDISNLKISVSSFDESESSIDEMMQMLKTEIENQNKSIEIKLKQIKDFEFEKLELKKQIEEAKKKVEGD